MPLSLQPHPLHGYLLEAKYHIHGASGFGQCMECDWLRVQISISASFCLLVAHTSHRAFFSPHITAAVFFFFFLFFRISLCRHHMCLSDASALSGVYRRLCLQSIIINVICGLWRSLHRLDPCTRLSPRAFITAQGSYNIRLASVLPINP